MGFDSLWSPAYNPFKVSLSYHLPIVIGQCNAGEPNSLPYFVGPGRVHVGNYMLSKFHNRARQLTSSTSGI